MINILHDGSSQKTITKLVAAGQKKSPKKAQKHEVNGNSAKDFRRFKEQAVDSQDDNSLIQALRHCQPQRKTLRLSPETLKFRLEKRAYFYTQPNGNRRTIIVDYEGIDVTREDHIEVLTGLKLSIVREPTISRLAWGKDNKKDLVQAIILPASGDSVLYSCLENRTRADFRCLNLLLTGR